MPVRSEAFAELNDKGTRCEVYFRWTDEAYRAVKALPGSRFVPRDKGGPYWTLPLDLVVMRRLREAFGPNLKLGDGLKRWGRQQVAKEREIRSIAVLDDYPLKDLILSEKLPELAKWLRPYQRADIKFMTTTNCLNLNEPRLGKTIEVIGSVFESDLENGPHLVCAPKSSLNSVWRKEVERWTGQVVVTYSGDLTKAEKIAAEETVERCLDKGLPFWFVTTPDMIRRGSYPQMVKEWNSFTIDEFHKTGLSEIKNVFPKAAAGVIAKRKFGLSGTPMGGKPIKLWGALHWIEPQQYTSKWAWAGMWLVVETAWGNHKKIGNIKEGLEEQFYLSLASHSVRRLRSEVLPQLPEKQWIDVDCEMTKKQAKQYNTFARDAEIRIDEYHLSATNVLAEYTRLKQFANSYCEVEVLGVDEEKGTVEMKVRATTESGKIPFLLDKLAEMGIDPEDPAGTSQALVVSQFRETADMIHAYLNEVGIKTAKITGKIKQKERDELQRRFQMNEDPDGYRVMVVVTAAAGVAITLDNVESVHVLDETWNPDDQEQATDRVINTTLLHQVMVLVYRSVGTIEQYIQEVNDMKIDINKDVLDLRRQGYIKAMREAA